MKRCFSIIVVAVAIGLAGASASGGIDVSAGKLAYVLDFCCNASGLPRRPGSWLVVSNLDGSKRRTMTPKPVKGDARSDQAPVWSPDGSRIAFVRSGVVTRAQGIYVVNADGRDLRELLSVPDDQIVAGPVWSPAGREIAVTLERHRDQCDPHSPGYEKPSDLRLEIVGIDGRKRLDVPELDARAYRRERHSISEGLAWSPDGKRLLYVVGQWARSDECRFGGRSLLYTIGADGSKRRLNVPLTYRIFDATWSPDSRRIAYTSGGYFGGPGAIQVLRADGTGQPDVAGCCDYYAWNLAWSSSGLFSITADAAVPGLYVASGPQQKNRLVVRAEISDEPWYSSILAVSHDGRRVAFAFLSDSGGGSYLATLSGELRPLPDAASVFLP